MAQPEEPLAAAIAADNLSIKRWLAVYAAYLLALVLPAAVLLERTGGPWREVLRDPAAVTRAADPVLKLLVFGIYISIAHTFLPLPTAPMVAAVAMCEFAPVRDVWATTLLVATVGAAASMMANLHDYHLFTWMLRHRRIGRVRQTALYRRAERWFARRPFALLVIFNLLPVPADPPVRMLAATYRHPLRPYAAANFIGRWVRYAVVAFVTFELGRAGWVAVAVLLAAAIVTAAARLKGRFTRGTDPVPARAASSPPSLDGRG